MFALYKPQKYLNKALLNLRRVSMRKNNIVGVHSIDFHNCLFNNRWYEMTKNFKSCSYQDFTIKQKTALIKSNQGIIEWIYNAANFTQSDKVILMLGSACQSYIDDYRHRITGIREIPQASVFSGLKILEDSIVRRLASNNVEVKLDPYLLADTFGDLILGTSFRLALEALENIPKKIQHENWVLDNTKMTILYGQIHKLASELPFDTKIHFHFYDDKKKIIDNLGEFFSNNLDLIPKNVTLNLSQYMGERPLVLHQLMGTGLVPDKNYNASIKKIVELCGYENDFVSIAQIIKVFNHKRLREFRAWRYEQCSHDDNADEPRLKEISFPLKSQPLPQTVFFSKTKVSPVEMIKVFSLDFDKCLYTGSYTKKITKCRRDNPEMFWGEFLELQNSILISENGNLLKHLVDEIKKSKNLNNVQLFFGTERQSFRADMINLIKGPDINGSAFQGLLMLRNQLEYDVGKVNKGLDIAVNHFLLADIYADIEHGKSFKLALFRMFQESRKWRANRIAEISEDYFDDHADWIFDDSKITIVYAHIHKLSLENPGVNIAYDFYDDRVDILESIQDFFESNLDLVPISVTITLNEYSGSNIRKMTIIKGKGGIDSDYNKSIKKLAELSNRQLMDFSEIVNIYKLLQVDDRMLNFKTWRDENISLTPNIPFVYEQINLIC